MYEGTDASAGIGIGKVAIIREVEMVIKSDRVTDRQAEIERSQGALNKTLVQIEKTMVELAEKVGEKETEIMQGHLMLLINPMLTGETENTITGESACSEHTTETVCSTYADAFTSMDDEPTQQRATDMKDIRMRVQQPLLGIKAADIASLPEGSVIVTRDLAPSMTAGINPAHVTGIMTELGGEASHSAILAGTLEIPVVATVAGALDEAEDGDELVLDSSERTVIMKPDVAIVAEYTGKREAFLKEKKELEQCAGKPTITEDGVSVELVVNIDKPEDAEKVPQYDGEDVGLFRTELLFIDRSLVPMENEQLEAYRKVAEALKGKPAIIRALDIDGDKETPYLGLARDENPSPGYRAIRFRLDRKEDVYRPQLRVLLRADAFGNVKIMTPLVIYIDEYREAKALIEELKAELNNQGIAYSKDIQVDIMVKTVAASLIADTFAKKMDFFSIGTSDLTQYTMLVGRDNDKVSHLYSTFNPVVLRSIKRTISRAREAGIMVGICGEAISDPMMIPLPLAFGLNEFSMSAPATLKVRKMIISYSVGELQAVADEAMSLATTEEVEDYMRAFVNR